MNKKKMQMGLLTYFIKNTTQKNSQCLRESNFLKFLRTLKNQARTDLKLYYTDTMELFHSGVLWFFVDATG